MDSNNMDNNTDNQIDNNPYDNADSQIDSNPYNNPNYSNPNFPKNPSIHSGEQPDTTGQEQNGQNPYGQNSYNQNPYNQNSYNQNPYEQNPYAQQSPYGQYPANPSNRGTNDKKQATGMEITSLVLGILSLTCCAGTGITAIIGLILLSVSKSKTKTYSGVGVAGLVCCIVGLIAAIIIIAVLVGTGFLAYYMETGSTPDFLLIFIH